MNISEIKIRKIFNQGRCKAIVSIVIDNDFALHDIKLIEGDSSFFIAMPSKSDKNGSFRDVAHPINRTARADLEFAIIAAYQEYLTVESEGVT